MSILLTSNIFKDESGFPFQPLPHTGCGSIATLLEQKGVGYEYYDGQGVDKEAYLNHLANTSAENIILILSEPYIQYLGEIKERCGEKNIVCCTNDESLIETIVFKYNIDFVIFGTGYAGLFDLIKTFYNKFNLFYDHIAGIAYKNGSGELTKTVAGSDLSERGVIPSAIYDQYERIVVANVAKDLPEEIGEKIIIDRSKQSVFTDFTKYKKVKSSADFFYLYLPASKKAIKTLIRIIEDVDDVENKLSIYPSCDVIEDKEFYVKMNECLELALKKKKSKFLTKIFTGRKLNKKLEHV